MCFSENMEQSEPYPIGNQKALQRSVLETHEQSDRYDIGIKYVLE